MTDRPPSSRTVREPARDIPIVAKADIVVVGGGPGGIMAAIAASRTGARTLLIERYDFSAAWLPLG